MPTYKLLIEYEGTRFSGWQAQGNTTKTVQGHLIKAAEQIMDGSVEIGGAGRTDAGVHAAMQVAHLRSHKPVPGDLLQRKLNDLLPHDIHVVSAERASDTFHARHDATSRVYMYQIATRRTAFAKPFVWWIKDTLDLAAMTKAAEAVPGRHDFSAFSDKRMAAEDSRIVVVDRLEIGMDGDLILIRIVASHFLWKMVRKLVAALVEVGRGSASPESFAELLAGPAEPIELTAPPSGLFLESIVYEGEEFNRPLEAVVPLRTVRNSGVAVVTKKKPEPREAKSTLPRFDDRNGKPPYEPRAPRAAPARPALSRTGTGRPFQGRTTSGRPASATSEPRARTYADAAPSPRPPHGKSTYARPSAGGTGARFKGPGSGPPKGGSRPPRKG